MSDVAVLDCTRAVTPMPESAAEKRFVELRGSERADGVGRGECRPAEAASRLAQQNGFAFPLLGKEDLIDQFGARARGA